VTVYGKAARPIAAFTGNERPRNMRVLLLDRDGKVVWFHDEGYSPRELLEMIGVIESLDEAKGA
jgi:predicted transcriptional regulator